MRRTLRSLQIVVESNNYLEGIDERGTLKTWYKGSEAKEWVAETKADLGLWVREELRKVIKMKWVGGRVATVNEAAAAAVIERIEKRIRKELGDDPTKYPLRILCHLHTLYTRRMTDREKANQIDGILASMTPEYDSEYQRIYHARCTLAATKGDLPGLLRLMTAAKARGLSIKSCIQFTLFAVMGSDKLDDKFAAAKGVLDAFGSKEYSEKTILYAVWCCRSKAEAEEMLQYYKFRDRRKAWSVGLWTALVRACRKSPNDAEGVVKDATQHGVVNVKLHGALIRVYNEVGDFEGVTNQVREIIRQGLPLTPIVLTEVIIACIHKAKSPHDIYSRTAEDAFCTALALGMEDDSFLWVELLEVYRRTSDITSAAILYDRRQHLSLPHSQAFVKRFIRMLSATPEGIEILHSKGLKPDPGPQKPGRKKRASLQIEGGLGKMVKGLANYAKY